MPSSRSSSSPRFHGLRRGVIAFTLAELLIALAILGVIATFTIPKVLQSQTDGRYNSIAKETAGTLSAAYQAYSLNNTPSASTSMGDLTPFMNYVKVDTTTTVDDINGGAAQLCGSAGAVCIQLHNGAIMWYWNYVNFGGTGTTNAMFTHLDPDGSVTGNKAINFYVYLSGKIRSEGEIEPNTVVGGNGTKNPNPANNPSWWKDWK